MKMEVNVHQSRFLRYPHNTWIHVGEAFLYLQWCSWSWPFPANRRRPINDELMLAQRLRRWSNIKSTSIQRLKWSFSCYFELHSDRDCYLIYIAVVVSVSLVYSLAVRSWFHSGIGFPAQPCLHKVHLHLDHTPKSLLTTNWRLSFTFTLLPCHSLSNYPLSTRNYGNCEDNFHVQEVGIMIHSDNVGLAVKDMCGSNNK